MAFGQMISTLKGLATGFKAALSGGMDLVKEIGQWISDFVGDVIQWAKDIGSWINDEVITPIGDFLEPLTPIVDAIGAAFGSIFDSLLAVFNGELFQSIVSWIKALKEGDVSIGDVFGAMVDFFGEKVQPLLDVWSAFKDGAVDIVGKFAGKIEDVPIIGKLVTFWNVFKNPAVKVALKDKFLGTIEKIPLIGALITFWNAFKNPAVKVGLKEKFMGALSELPIIGPLIDFWNKFQGSSDADKVKLMNKFVGKLEDLPVIGPLITWWKEFNEANISIGELFSGMIPAPLQTIIDFFAGVLGIGEENEGILDKLGDIMGALFDTIKGPVNDFIIDPINALMGIDLPVIGKLQDLPLLSTFFPITPLAEGAIVNSPTLALIGEAGPEAVVPLNSQGRGMGGGNQTFNMTFNLSGITDRTDKRKLAQDVSQMIRTELRRDIGSTAVRGGLA